MDVVKFLSSLIRFNSITPDIKCVEFFGNELKKIGFNVDFQIFKDTGNLYAIIGNKSGKNLCFSGHTDVVPLIDRAKWKFDPFELTEEDGLLYGRGSSDMKGGIAAFFIAIRDLLQSGKIDQYLKNKCVSFLITGDEEVGFGNGTKKMLEYLNSKGDLKIDYCLIGEPTSENESLGSINIGRRGSLNFSIKIKGKDGHVAYPQYFDNPITKAVKICNDLKIIKLDTGDEFWEASNLEITRFFAPNEASNIILNEVEFNGNIRFNKYQTIEKLVEKIEKICSLYCKIEDFQLNWQSSHGGYSSEISDFAKMMKSSASKYSPSKNCEFITTGGVTDGSFIKKYCKNIYELGLKIKTMHKINEYIELEDLQNLQKAYSDIIEEFLKCDLY